MWFARISCLVSAHFLCRGEGRRPRRTAFLLLTHHGIVRRQGRPSSSKADSWWLRNRTAGSPRAKSDTGPRGHRWQLLQGCAAITQINPDCCLPKEASRARSLSAPPGDPAAGAEQADGSPPASVGTAHGDCGSRLGSRGAVKLVQASGRILLGGSPVIPLFAEETFPSAFLFISRQTSGNRAVFN